MSAQGTCASAELVEAADLVALIEAYVGAAEEPELWHRLTRDARGHVPGNPNDRDCELFRGLTAMAERAKERNFIVRYAKYSSGPTVEAGALDDLVPRGVQ